MGYYTKHIFKIKESNSQEDLKTLMETITKYSGYDFHLVEKHMCFDDRIWNSGLGCKFYDLDEVLLKVTKEIPEISFDVYCHGECGDEYIYHCSSGKIQTEELTDTNDDIDFYFNSDNKIDYID